MTRVFRSILLVFIAVQLFMLWLTGIYEPHNLYAEMFETQQVVWLPWAGLLAAVWLIVDVALITFWPRFCKIGDKLRFYPLVFSLAVACVTMYAGKYILFIWVHYGFTTLLIGACMLADAKYNNKKYCGIKGVTNASFKG